MLSTVARTRPDFIGCGWATTDWLADGRVMDGCIAVGGVVEGWVADAWVIDGWVGISWVGGADCCVVVGGARVTGNETPGSGIFVPCRQTVVQPTHEKHSSCNGNSLETQNFDDYRYTVQLTMHMYMYMYITVLSTGTHIKVCTYTCTYFHNDSFHVGWMTRLMHAVAIGYSSL